MNDFGTQRFQINIPRDERGLTGRECPSTECQGYFKIEFGTGLKGKDLPCHCPYCGHVGDQSKFYTKEQLEYAKSVVLNKLTDSLLRELKKHEFNYPARGMFGIGMSMKVTGEPHSIYYYREKELETEVICDNCTLRYAIYGVFAYCPDCGVHNSLQILNKNLDLFEKEIALAKTQETELATYLVGDSLENIVSAFDAFGRETCRISSALASNPSQAEGISFQNLYGARERVRKLFGFDLASAVSADDWEFVCRCFQKRHLLAHKMGVVDDEYVQITKDPQAVIGRKILVAPDEVLAFLAIVRTLGAYFIANLPGTKSSP